MTEIEALLKNGADANTKDNNGFSLLMSFSKLSDIPSLKVLLAHGANISAKDTTGYTALDYGIISGDLKTVEFLVDSGAVVTSDSYMLAIRKNMKHIVQYFDTMDENKQVFLKKKRS